jgi:hypothetical protein
VQCFPGAWCVSTGVTGAPRPGRRPDLSASYSTDGGLDWSPGSVRSLPGLPLTLSCSNAQTCMAAAWLAGRAEAALFVSHNEGESWSMIEAQGLPAGKLFRGLACPSTIACWISGDTAINRGGSKTADGDTGGVVLSSTNGERTWQSTGLPKGIRGIDALSCPSPSTCFAGDHGARRMVVRPTCTPVVVLLAYTAAPQ